MSGKSTIDVLNKVKKTALDEEIASMWLTIGIIRG